jgi:hypothetical protein
MIPAIRGFDAPKRAQFSILSANDSRALLFREQGLFRRHGCYRYIGW